MRSEIVDCQPDARLVVESRQHHRQVADGRRLHHDVVPLTLSGQKEQEVHRRKCSRQQDQSTADHQQPAGPCSWQQPGRDRLGQHEGRCADQVNRESRQGEDDCV
jgi:hypothetical protein